MTRNIIPRNSFWSTTSSDKIDRIWASYVRRLFLISTAFVLCNFRWNEKKATVWVKTFHILRYAFLNSRSCEILYWGLAPFQSQHCESIVEPYYNELRYTNPHYNEPRYNESHFITNKSAVQYLPYLINFKKDFVCSDILNTFF